MSRLKQTLKELQKVGYEISSLKKLKGGINSATFKVIGNEGTIYALKIYPIANNKDSRDRCITEKVYLNYLRICKIDNTPKLVASAPSSGWSLLTWIEGEKPICLRGSHLQEITNFIGKSNTNETKKLRDQLRTASEACLSPLELITSIETRIKKLQQTIPSSATSQKALEWIKTTIEPRFLYLSIDLLRTRAHCSHWRDLDTCKVASASDVGIHNIMQTKKDLHFIDFEYAGIDDLSKLAADWILQPEYCLNQEQEQFFTDILLKKMSLQIGDSWIERLTDIKPIIHTKWCLIMLNALKNNALTEHQLQKTIHYFASAKHLFQHGK